MKAFFFIGAGAGTGAGEKKNRRRAGQKWTGSATLQLTTTTGIINYSLNAITGGCATVTGIRLDTGGGVPLPLPPPQPGGIWGGYIGTVAYILYIGPRDWRKLRQQQQTTKQHALCSRIYYFEFFLAYF